MREPSYPICKCISNRDGYTDPDCDICQEYESACNDYWMWYFNVKPGKGPDKAMKPFSKEDHESAWKQKRYGIESE